LQPATIRTARRAGERRELASRLKTIILAAWRKRLLLKTVGLTCRSARTRGIAFPPPKEKYDKSCANDSAIARRSFVSFFKRSHKVIGALTVQEIFDEHIAKKLV